MKTLTHIALSTFCMVAVSSASATNYTLTNLSAAGLYGRSINNLGQVAGNAWVGGELHTVVWQDGVLTDLGSNGNPMAFGIGLNSLGHVAGYTQTQSYRSTATVWKDGQVIELGAPANSQGTYADAINTAGQVAGHAIDLSGRRRPLLWNGTTLTELGTLGGGGAGPAAMNDHGQIVGYSELAGGGHHATLWENGNVIDLGSLGGSYSYARGISSNGLIAMSSYLEGDFEVHAVLSQNGNLIDLGAPEGYHSEANAVNSGGLVVGSAFTHSTREHAALWSNGDMIDLNTLISGGMNEFAELMSATGINDAGQIIGLGSLSGGGTATFLLTPVANVPEPHNWAMMLAGLLMVAGTMRRKA